MAAAWAAQAVGAVGTWAALEGDSVTPDGWRCAGRAVPSGDPGWLVLDTRDQPLHPDTLVGLCLAGEDGPDAGRWHVADELRIAHAVVLLRAPAGLPRHSRYVWVRTRSRRLLLETLRAGLAHAGPAPLAEALAAGALAGPPDAGVPAPPGLTAAQADAYRACHTSGLRLVWGAAGTGRTRVLARAVQDLVAAGRRVLLVSTTDAALDAALHTALPGLPDAPGTAVRVGPAHLAEIAGHAGVQLDLLAGRESADVDRRRLRVARQLDELAAVDADVDDLITRLAGYDDQSYRAAAARVTAGREVAAMEPEQHAAEARLERVRSGVAATLDGAARLEDELAELAPARAAYARAAALAGEEDQAEREVRRRAISLATVEAVPAHQGGLLARWRRRKVTAQLTAELRAAEGARDHVRVRIAEHRATAAPVTEEDLAAVDERWRRASESAAAAREKIAQAESERDAVVARIAALRSAGAPTAADHELVRHCEQKQLPEHHERLRHLLILQSGAVGLRVRLEEEHREVAERSRQQREETENRLLGDARVVATTPARARLHPAIADARFDVVLVDDAGAVPLAELLLVLCRASATAVLFGDLRRPAPVLPPAVERSGDAEVWRWVHRSCFVHTGVRTPADALRVDGCIPLLHQFRFGPGLCRLVNDVGHEVLQDASELAGPPGAEVVLVDVSTLAGLGEVRRGRHGGRWRVAGSVLSCAIAELHGAEGRAGAGIVTPYRRQVGATLAVLRDHGLAEVPVGTAAEAPDRTFGVAVLDLVDDGPGWAARGGETAADGVRRLVGATLGMGLTRLYVITDLRAIRAAVAGPLVHLGGALDRGDIRVWSAAALLGLADPPGAVVDTAFADAARVVQRLMPVTDLRDADAAAELARHVESARHAIWMWSPWSVRRAATVTPQLAEAAARGVDVRLYLRPDEDRELRAAPAGGGLPALTAAGATTVIRSGDRHDDVMVVDGRTVLLATGDDGPGDTAAGDAGRTAMATLTGARFAEHLLDDMHGPAARPKACPGCGAGLETRRSSVRGREPRLLCAPCRQAPTRSRAAGDQGV